MVNDGIFLPDEEEKDWIEIPDDDMDDQLEEIGEYNTVLLCRLCGSPFDSYQDLVEVLDKGKKCVKRRVEKALNNSAPLSQPRGVGRSTLYAKAEKIRR